MEKAAHYILCGRVYFTEGTWEWKYICRSKYQGKLIDKIGMMRSGGDVYVEYIIKEHIKGEGSKTIFSTDRPFIHPMDN